MSSSRHILRLQIRTCPPAETSQALVLRWSLKRARHYHDCFHDDRLCARRLGLFNGAESSAEGEEAEILSECLRFCGVMNVDLKIDFDCIVILCAGRCGAGCGVSAAPGRAVPRAAERPAHSEKPPSPVKPATHHIACAGAILTEGSQIPEALLSASIGRWEWDRNAARSVQDSTAPLGRGGGSPIRLAQVGSRMADPAIP